MEKFNFAMEPGKKRNHARENATVFSPLISVIVPYYNGKKYIEQTITSVLNQTFQAYEILIIDDGSTDQESLQLLEKIQTWDKRIHVYHKANEGLAATRDYGAEKSIETVQYLMFLDDDDLLEPTFLECGYWTLETNLDAAWTYSDSIGFGTQQYTWNKYFDSERMKTENILISAALVRKSDFFAVHGYEVREKAVHEDWNFWLKLLEQGKYPVHMSFYGQWYRRKEKGELQRARENETRSYEIIQNTAQTIHKKVQAIQYPRYSYERTSMSDREETIPLWEDPETKDKINWLWVLPNLEDNQTNRELLQRMEQLDPGQYTVTIFLTEPGLNVMRQSFEQMGRATVYDLTSFLNQHDWLPFAQYIMKKKHISDVWNAEEKKIHLKMKWNRFYFFQMEKSYRIQCSTYEKKVYGTSYTISEEELEEQKDWKEMLWKIPIWRGLIHIYHKLLKRK